MAYRTQTKQSEHDAAVEAARQIYQDHGKHAWTNPGSEKNKAWGGRYIDVIAVEKVSDTSAWVIEVETADSVSDSEAQGQWKDYDSVFEHWHLAVPTEAEAAAENLLRKHGISHCTVITWRRNSNGTHTFWGLPGV